MDFKEDFLQAVWKHQYFDKQGLETTNGQSLEIRKIGYHNQHEGPDFLESQVRIGNIDLHGHIEIHIHSSDWHAHDHSDNARYSPVILHVVWSHDREVMNPDGQTIPTLELKGRIFLDTIRNYERLTESRQEIICSPLLTQVPGILRFSMLEKALIERLEHKSEALSQILNDIQNDWEEAAFRWLFYCFGFKTNSEPMLELAQKIPMRHLLKLQGNTRSIRAILLGMAGLIPENPTDEEGKELSLEFDYQRKKLKLSPPLLRQDWKLMGVRPQNFPAKRLVQLAEILATKKLLFSTLLHHCETKEAFGDFMAIHIPEYWRKHYQVGHPSPKVHSATLGKSTLNLLAINLLAPLWYQYGKFVQQSEWREKSLDFLQSLPAEANYITRKYVDFDMENQTAFDSQALIGLFQDYCRPKRCLQCKIGQSLLKPDKA